LVDQQPVASHELAARVVGVGQDAWMQHDLVARRRRRRALRVGLASLLGLSAAAALGVQIVFDVYKIPSGAMPPTLEPGDRVLAWSLGGPDPRRGDVVIFEPPPNAAPGTQGVATAVSRVAGVGGDRVAVADGRLTLNGQVVDEPYLAPGTTTEGLESTLVATDSIFLLGDNRANALDSRFYGPVPDDSVRARVTFTNLPLDWITLGVVVVTGLAFGLVALSPANRRDGAGPGSASGLARDGRRALPLADA
jgi:signal peptidase I